MKKKHVRPLVNLAVIAACALCAPAYADCTPGNNPIANVRAARINAEQQNIDQARTAAQQQNQATASCQIAMNSDIIKTAIPDALNGVMSFVRGFNPSTLISGAMAAVGSMVSQEGACRIANNVTGAAVRSVRNVGVNAANSAINSTIGGTVGAVNTGIGAVNGVAGNTGAGVYAPSVTAPAVQNSSAPGASFFDNLACKVFSRC